MFKKALIASAMLVSVISANAAGSSSFLVSGTSNPGACNISLDSNSKADYGTYTPTQLKALPTYNWTTPGYHLGGKDVVLTVACSSATKAEVSFLDNKPGKAMPMDMYDSLRFGMVDGSGNSPIGGFDIYLANILIDGVAPAGALIAATGTTNWSTTAPANLSAFFAFPNYSNGFIKTAGNTTPDSFTNMTLILRINAFLNKSYMDSATNSVNFNGGGVITIQYL